jgi:hypothetical protein
MFRMATLALRCGLTNVVGVNIGASHNYHSKLQVFRGTLLIPTYEAHGTGYVPGLHNVMKWIAGLIAEMLAALGPLADSTVVTMVGGTGASRREGENHHGMPKRFPAFVYDGTGTLRTGGRYLAYPPMQRSILDLYCSVAHALGAPTDRFGEGAQVARGPLPELMA